MRVLFARIFLAGASAVALLFPGASAQAAGTWHEVPLPALWPQNFLYELEAAGPDDVWIGGGQGRFCIRGPAPYSCLLSSVGNPVVRRWDGGRWVEYPLRNLPAKTGPIDDLGAIPGEVWVHSFVQLDQPEYLARFDGTAFQKVEPPAPRAVALSVNPAGIWIRGTGSQYRWNGSGWTLTPMPAGSSGISGEVLSKSPTEAWGLSIEGQVSSLLRWNGTAWTKVTDIPKPGEWDFVREIAVRAPGEVWALQEPRGDTSPSRVFRYHNGAWTEQTPPVPARLYSLRVDGLGRLVADGYPIQTPTVAATFRFTGTGWVAEPPPAPGVSSAGFVGVPGTDLLWGFASYPAKVFTNS
ncbi:MAG: hypothetical protein ABIS86_14010 [Streptosporangiaceae bacterium]